MASSSPKRYDAFLSYNSQDRRAVEGLAARLRQGGLELYLEVWELAPGRELQPALARGLRDSKACVVFLGPNGLGPWQNQELQVAIDKRARDEDFHVIPVLLPGAERPRRGDVRLDFLVNASWVEFLKTLDDDSAFQALVWGITGTRPGPTDLTRYEGVCPYRGLEAFRPDDARFFFGRDHLTGWLVSALRSEVRAAQGVRFLGVLGPSGSGKSSVVLAGMVPRLKAGAIEGSERWPVAILRTGDDPLKNLAAGVVSQFRPPGALPDVGEILELADALRGDARALDVFAQAALDGQPEDVRLAVVVDQFEEVFTHRPQDTQAQARFEQDRAAFLANLLHAAKVPAGRVAVVLSMRSDFLGACASFPQLAAVLSAHAELVGPMTGDELREAIERPAYLVGCEVEPALTERLLADVAGRPGALPLLQFALTEVWKKRDVRKLTLRAYNELGGGQGEASGIEGALEHRANEIFGALPPEDQDLCRRVFLRLVQPGEGTEDTKRRVSFRELLPNDPAKAEAVRKLIHTLADRGARLITTEGTDDSDGAVEVAHEALIRSWTQLRKWVDSERVGLRIRRQLTEAAREWQVHGREPSFLYTGTRLLVTRDWAEAHADDLNDLEAEFLAASWRRHRRGKTARAALILGVLAAVFVGWEGLRWQADMRKAESLREKKLQFDKSSKAIDTAVVDARKLSLEGRWSEAIKELEGAKGLLERGAEYESLHRRIAAALGLYTAKAAEQERAEAARQALEHDRTVVAALDEVRLMAADSAEQADLTTQKIIDGYGRAFRDGAIAIDSLAPEKAAELIRAKPREIREAMGATLDVWALRAGPPDQLRLRTIARLADPDPWRNAIRAAVAEKDAPELLRRAREDDVDDQPATTLNHLGWALAQAREIDEAVKLLRRAQRRHPHDFWINYNLATFFGSTAPPQIDEAIRYYSVAVAIRPHSPGANTLIGVALSKKGRFDEAFFYLNEAIDLAPKLVTVHLNRGAAWGAKDEHDKAIADYDKAIELDPKSARAYNNRGRARYAKREYDRAIADLDEAIKLDPKFTLAYADRGRAWSEKHEYQKAIADFGKAAELDPQLKPTLRSECSHRAWILATSADEKLRDGKRAVEFGTMACELTGWNDPLTLDTLAAACAEAGDFGTAIKWQEKAIGLLTKDDAARRKDFDARLELYRAEKPYRAEAKAADANNQGKPPVLP